MNRDVPLKKYAKKMNHSYTFGAFPTIELLKNQPEHVLKVLLHPDMNSETQLEIITDLCNRHNIYRSNGPQKWLKNSETKRTSSLSVCLKNTRTSWIQQRIISFLSTRVIWGIWERSSGQASVLVSKILRS